MSNVVNMSTSGVVDLGPELCGQHVVVEGRVIPKLTAHDRGKEIEFIIDGRFAFFIPRDLSADFASALATSLAVGAGYSNIHADAPLRNFAPQIRKL